MKRSTLTCLVCFVSALTSGCLFEYSEFDFEEEESGNEEPSPEESDAGTNERRTPAADAEPASE